MQSKEKVLITPEVLDRFKLWLENASQEEIDEQIVSDDERKQILQEVQKLSDIPVQDLQRKCA